MKINKPNYNWGYALTPRSLTTHLIIHHSAGSGSAEAIHNYHLSLGWAGIAYHYYVRRDGTIFAGRPENMRGGHTTNWNWCSLGVCFEGNFENEQMSAQQLAAGSELIADIKRRYPTIVIGKHSEYGQTACPGKNFPFAEMISGCDIEPEKDVEDKPEPDDWAKNACEQAVATGLFLGDGKGNYNWKNAVTRQELAVVLARVRAIENAELRIEN